jgi:hypothetical protein
MLSRMNWTCKCSTGDGWSTWMCVILESTLPEPKIPHLHFRCLTLSHSPFSGPSSSRPTQSPHRTSLAKSGSSSQATSLSFSSSLRSTTYHNSSDAQSTLMGIDVGMTGRLWNLMLRSLVGWRSPLRWRTMRRVSCW